MSAKLKFPKDYLNKIICGDCLEIMKTMPDESINLVVTSPPYNLKNSTGNGMKDGRGGKWSRAALINGYSHHDDCMPHEEYVSWQIKCLEEMNRLIKNDGAIFYNHKWRVQNGLLQDRHDIVSRFSVRQIIIWKRKGGINFNAGYFLPTYEVIYLIAKPDFKLASKANAYGDVWEFTQEMKNGHPAPFPVTLIRRIVSSTNAKIVLDPFMGSGTTAVVAQQLKRNYIGIDISPEYCRMARERIVLEQKAFADEPYKKEYVLGARLKNLNNALKEKILDKKHYKGNDDFCIAQFEYEVDRKSVVSYKESRARKDVLDREKTKKLQKITRYHLT